MIRGKSPQYEQNSKLQVDYDDAREITAVRTAGGTGPIHEGLSQTSRQFYRPETRGRYLGEPVHLTVSR